MSWTPRRAAALSRRQLKALRSRVESHLSAVARQWGDEDCYLENTADELKRSILDQLDEYEKLLGACLEERLHADADRDQSNSLF